MLGKETQEDLQNSWRDQYKQWYAAGMPMYTSDDLAPAKSIRINFKTKEDRAAFSEKFNYKLTDKTTQVWYPDKKKEVKTLSRYIED